MVGYRLTSIATVSEVDYLRKTVGTATLVRISKDQHHIIFWGIDAGLLTTWSYGEYDLEWYLGLLMVALQEAAVQFLGGGVEPSWSLDLMRSQIEKYNGSEVYRRIRQLRFKASTVLRRRLSEADPELLPMLQQEENGDRLRWLEIYEKVLNTDLSKIKVTAVPAGTSGENLVVSRHVLLWAVQAHDDRLWEMLPEEREVVFHRVGIARNLWMQETAIKNQRRKTPERFIGIPESDVLRQYGVVVEEANIKKRLRRIEEAKETDEHVVCLICGAVMFGTFTQDGSMKHIGYDSRKTDWVCMTKVRREGWSAIITETEAEGKALGSEIRRNGSPYSRWLATLREGYEANKIQVRKDIATFLQQNVVEIPGALQVITLVDDDLLTHIELQTCLSKAPEVHPLALDPVLESRAPTQREKDAGVKGSMWSLRIIAPRAVKKVKSVVQKRWKKEEEDLLIADVRDIPEAQRGRTGCPSKPDLQRLGAKYGVSESSVQSKIMSLLKKY
ncbi:hypothetical protein HK101_002596 [Irineochytrium annulatum]|nr:hypothetical protein HK101_002596 [Irineochytrium annulatum]